MGQKMNMSHNSMIFCPIMWKKLWSVAGFQVLTLYTLAKKQSANLFELSPPLYKSFKKILCPGITKWKYIFVNIFIRCLIIFQVKSCTDLPIKHAPAPPGQRPAFSPRAPASTLSFSVFSTLSSISLVTCCWYNHQNISSWAGQRLLWLLSVLHAQCLCTQLRHG